MFTTALTRNPASYPNPNHSESARVLGEQGGYKGLLLHCSLRRKGVEMG